MTKIKVNDKIFDIDRVELMGVTDNQRKFYLRWRGDKIIVRFAPEWSSKSDIYGDDEFYEDEQLQYIAKDNAEETHIFEQGEYTNFRSNNTRNDTEELIKSLLDDNGYSIVF